MNMERLTGLANSEYNSRPDEEKLPSITEGLERSLAFESAAREVTRTLAEYRLAASGDSLVMVSPKPSATPAVLSHNAFGQLCGFSKAPASYLRELPPTLTAQCANFHLSKLPADKPNMLYMAPRSDDAWGILSINSERYDRGGGNSVPFRALLNLEQNHGWRVPPAWAREGERTPGARKATADDIIPGGSLVKEGDLIAPAGIYLRPGENMFGFVMDPKPAIEIDGGPLYRVCLVSNDITGKGRLIILRGLLALVCGNHNWFGVKELTVGAAVHKDGRASELAENFTRDVEELALTGDPDREYRMIRAMQVLKLGEKAEDVTKAVLAQRIPGLNAANVTAAIQTADETGRYGPSNTLWGVYSGLTQNSQALGSFEARHAMDLAAGRLADTLIQF